MRVHERLSGAHFILPNESSLAVRTYDISNMPPPCHHDGLEDFFRLFRFAVVFFVLDLESQQSLQADANSFVSYASRTALAMTHQPDDNIDGSSGYRNNVETSKSHQSGKENGGHNSNHQGRYFKNPPRIVIVPSSSLALDSLIDMTNALNRASERSAYFSRKQNEVLQQRDPLRAFQHVCDHHLGLPPGESDVVWKCAGGTMTSLWNMTTEQVYSIPLDHSSKQKLCTFLGLQEIQSGDPYDARPPSWGFPIDNGAMNDPRLLQQGHSSFGGQPASCNVGVGSRQTREHSAYPLPPSWALPPNPRHNFYAPHVPATPSHAAVVERFAPHNAPWQSGDLQSKQPAVRYSAHIYDHVNDMSGRAPQPLPHNIPYFGGGEQYLGPTHPPVATYYENEPQPTIAHSQPPGRVLRDLQAAPTPWGSSRPFIPRLGDLQRSRRFPRGQS